MYNLGFPFVNGIMYQRILYFTSLNGRFKQFSLERNVPVTLNLSKKEYSSEECLISILYSQQGVTSVSNK